MFKHSTKKIVLTMSLSIISLANVAQAQNTKMDTSGFSACEKNIWHSLDEEGAKQLKSHRFSNVATSSVAGALGYVITSVGLSSSENLWIAETVGSEALPIFFAVGTAGIGYLISTGFEYNSFHQAGVKDLYQLFRDVRNEGMGPQIETRIDIVQKMLMDLKAKMEPKFIQLTGATFSDETTKTENIRVALMQSTLSFLNSNGEKCVSVQAVSRNIDLLAIKLLTEKFNPKLKANIIQSLQDMEPK